MTGNAPPPQLFDQSAPNCRLIRTDCPRAETRQAPAHARLDDRLAPACAGKIQNDERNGLPERENSKPTTEPHGTMNMNLETQSPEPYHAARSKNDAQAY